MLLSTHISVLEKFGDSPDYRNSASSGAGQEVVLDFPALIFIPVNKRVKERLHDWEERDAAMHFEACEHRCSSHAGRPMSRAQTFA